MMRSISHLLSDTKLSGTLVMNTISYEINTFTTLEVRNSYHSLNLVTYLAPRIWEQV